jgi:membrane fusion protein (multidrug efflux system)
VSAGVAEADAFKSDEPVTTLRHAPDQAERTASEPEPVVSRTRARRRRLLMAAVPVLAVVGATFAYLQAGRYVSTDNAYVKGHVVNVAPEIGGTISEVLVEEYQKVAAGAPLFRLREDAFRIALAQAAAALAQAESDINTDKQAYRRALAEIERHRSTAAFARTQFERQERLRRSNLGSAEALDTARYALDMAVQETTVTEREAATLLARLDGDLDAPIEQYPRYRAALAAYHQAQLDLERTEVRAPFAGVVTNRPEPGDFVDRGMPAMALVDDVDLWVEANFKETQLTYVTVGQPVTLEVDTFPGRTWRGTVLSLSETTGAEFALLPPQNATGNWVKIVQRIPVRIALEDTDGLPALRIGMSTSVTVDTGHKRTWRDLLPDL